MDERSKVKMRRTQKIELRKGGKNGDGEEEKEGRRRGENEKEGEREGGKRTKNKRRK